MIAVIHVAPVKHAAFHARLDRLAVSACASEFGDADSLLDQPYQTGDLIMQRDNRKSEIDRGSVSPTPKRMFNNKCRWCGRSYRSPFASRVCPPPAGSPRGVRSTCHSRLYMQRKKTITLMRNGADVIPCRVCFKPVERLIKGWRFLCQSVELSSSGKPKHSRCREYNKSREAQKASSKRYDDKNREHRKSDQRQPEYRARERKNYRASRIANPELWRARWRRADIRKRERAAGISLVATYQADGANLLAEARRLVPGYFDPSTRDEIIGEAVMLALEGRPIANAVKLATSTVTNAAAAGRYAKPIDECFWL